MAKAKTILKEEAVIEEPILAAAEEEVVPIVEEVKSEPELVVEPVLAEADSVSATTEMIGERTKEEHLRLRLLGYI